MSNPAESFEPFRRRLLGLAYRMLGSMADAEDAVQETYLRWHGTDRGRVSEPGISHDCDSNLSRYADLGSCPGIVVESPGGPVQTSAFEIEGDLIRALYVVRNPDKLRHLAPKQRQTSPE
jgi:hypothetical protein